MSQNNPKSFIYDHITSIRFDTYEFTLAYADKLDNMTAEFAHQHPFYEIYFTLEKYIQIKIKDEIIKLKKHELLFIAKNVEHQVLFEPDCNFRYFVLIWDLFPVITQTYRGPEGIHEWEDLRQAIERIDKRLFIHSEVPFDGHEILDVIQNELDRKQLAWNSSIVFKMYDFLIRALRHTVRIRVTDQNLAGMLNLGIAASKYLHAHFTEPITLEDAAKHLNYSSRHVNRAYMKIFNTSVMRNLNLLRIEYAKRYLCLTDYSIEKISELTGFSCSRTLYKLFKKYVGISMSQYRNMQFRQDKALKTPAGGGSNSN
ncbi:helix-turn-helix transcriptional regulator [Treponema sp. TIM-1]|uniref:helix-turn-helix domain-containing protein n=1 Tax=Treponema sp. TIM-1 TaxID=2898417 RepID=UPI0039809218